MTTHKLDTISLLSQRSTDFLDLIAPQWQLLQLKSQTTATLECLQALVSCNLLTLGDLTTVTPLMLLALGAKVAGPTPEGEPFWKYLLQQERDAIKPVLQMILIEHINTTLLQPQMPAHFQPAEEETGYSSLLIQPGEVIDHLTFPDSITIVNWPHGLKRPVAFAAGEICATPLLATPLRDALRAAGCDLRSVPISVLPLSIRTANPCTRAHITTIETLTSQTPEQLMTLHNFGPRALEEVLHALRDYLLPRLEVVPPDTLVPPERLHSFAVKDTGAFPSPSAPAGHFLTSAENDSRYSSLFIRLMKVLQQTLHPTAQTISLITPAGKGPAVHFRKGEVGNTPLLAKHIRKALRAQGYDLKAVRLDSLPLAPRTGYLCELGGITTLESLLAQTPNALLGLPGFNPRYYQEIANTLPGYLTPWLRKFPLEILAPQPSIMPSLFDPDDKARTDADNLQTQNHPPLRRGKNALFFPIDAVLQAMGLYSSPADASVDGLSEEEVGQNALLSERLITALAARECDLASISVQELFSRGGFESTPLSVRTYNVLVRAGIRTLGLLASQTPKDLLRIHNFGVGCYREIIASLHTYLQPWLDTLGIDPASEDSLLAYQDSPPLVLDMPAEPEETITLSDIFPALIAPDLFDWLDDCEAPWRQLPMTEACPALSTDEKSIPQDSLTIGDLMAPGQKTNAEPLIAPELAEQAIAEIQQTLIAMLAKHIIETAPSEQEQENHRQALMPASTASLLAELLNEYTLSNRKSSGRTADDLPRELHVLLARTGVITGQPQTLEEIGTAFSLTRERVRQLEQRAEERLHQGTVRLFVEGLAALATWAIQAEGGVTTVSGAAQRLATWLPFGDLDPAATTRLLVKWATNTAVKGDARLVSSNVAPELLDEIDDHLEQIVNTQSAGLPLERLIDMVMLAGGEALLNAGEQFVAAAIRTADGIEIQGNFCLPRSRGAMRGQLISVLRTVGRPTHFNEIAERYNAMFPEEKSRSGHAVQAILLRYPETFARTGNGTYALAEAGYEGALTVVDALERILQESDRPLHAHEIVALGKERFQWKETTLQAGLRTNSTIVSFGHGFFGLADRTYPNFKVAEMYKELFGIEPVLRERRVLATYTNQQHHPVIQMSLSENTLQGSIGLTSKALRDLFPVQGVFKARGLAPGQPARDLSIKRGQYDVSGLARWFNHQNAQPGDFLFIEKLADEQALEEYFFRLAYAPADKLPEAMQLVGLSPTDEAGGAFDYRVLWRCREPEKLSALLTYMLEQSWPTTQAVNTALGFAPGSPHGADYVELGLLGGLLAIGKVEQDAPTEIVRPTPFGRAWIAEQHDAETLAISLALSLPPYRAHLRSDFLEEQTDDDIDVEQMTTALLDPKLLAAWDVRFGLAEPMLRDRALRESNAVVTTARLPAPVLTLLLLLLAAQSHGLAISLPAAEAGGLANAQEAALRLRQLGIAVQWDASGQAALAEQVNLAVTSSASVEARLRAHNGPLGAALAEGWRTIQQNAWPLHPLSTTDLYKAMMSTHGSLFTPLMAPTPEGVDHAARDVNGRCVPCPFVSLAADWGLVPTGNAPIPFAFLSHATRLIGGQTVEPIAICLSRELLAQDWDAKRALAANAHLALLTLIASDTGGLAARCSLGEQGYLLCGEPLIQALDDFLRDLGYAVWDEGYRQDAAKQAALGRELVALGGQLGLFASSANGFETLPPLATAVYDSGYDVLLRLQALFQHLATETHERTE